MTEKKTNAFHVEEGKHMEAGYPVWRIVDDLGGVWGEFSVRVAATACLRGYAAIDFVPRPHESSERHGEER